MTTADLIVVMNQGRIEQAGSPEDIYKRPRSEFVAHFIGGANVLKGERLPGDAVDVGGVVLRCGSGDFAAQGPTSVAIRHHDINLVTSAPTPGETNWVPGTVTRQVYLGSHRDYLVTLSNGDSIRTVTPADIAVPQGQAVWLHLPPEHCRALAH
jgi:iron(III) transport system ATP-binding protein